MQEGAQAPACAMLWPLNIGYFWRVTRARLADIRHFLSKTSLRKLWNAGLLLATYYASKYLRKNLHLGAPISISIEPTTACNLRCPECPSGLRSFTRPRGSLERDFFRQTIDQLAPTTFSLTFYFQGEPFLHPQFLDMVDYADRKGLYTVTSTNGHFLDDQVAERTVRSGLKRLIISIDGATQETYQAYRKEGQLSQVIAGAKKVIKWRRTLGSTSPYVIFQFLVVRPNEHEIPAVEALAAEIGVDEVKLKTAQIYDYQQGNALIPSNERFSRYIRQSDGTYRAKQKMEDSCWKMWHSAVITWDGRVVPCCFDKDATHQLGSLRDRSFQDIWRGAAYRQFRAQLIADRRSVDICLNCTEGCSVWAKA